MGELLEPFGEEDLRARRVDADHVALAELGVVHELAADEGARRRVLGEICVGLVGDDVFELPNKCLRPIRAVALLQF